MRTAQPQGSSAPASSASASASPSTGIIKTGYVPADSPLEFDVLALGRVNADTVALRVRLSNVGGGNPNIDAIFSDSSDAASSGLEAGSPWGALELVDGQDLKAYHPLTNVSNSSVLQSGFPTSGNDRYAMPPGNSFISTIMFPAPPAGVTAVDIEANEMVPIVNVPIAASFHLRPGDPDPNAQVNKPYIETFTSRADSLDKTKSLDRHGTTVDVRLNADVLFKFDKYKLTPKADSVLKDVAKRIDKSKATTIHVEGYTDSKGSDSYNKLLSQRRAASVRGALKKLVTRTGISYTTAGHGESDPVASNDTKQGRQKNRRVAVTLGS